MNPNFDSKESFLSYKLNIFKELYNAERERRNIASQKISRIIPLIVAMFGGDAYIITKVGKIILSNRGLSTDTRNVISCILCIVTIISGAILLYFLVKSYINFNNKMLDPNKFNEMFEIGDKQILDGNYEETVKEINKKLYEEYKTITIKLSNEIDKREDYITKLYLSLITNCLFACFTLIVIWIWYTILLK